MYLNCHSFYSLRYGTLSIRQLLVEAQQKGAEALALTDINNTSACLEFIRMAPAFGIRPLVGIDFRNGSRQLYVGIAKNNEGFQELNTYLSGFLTTEKPLIPARAPAFANAWVIYPFGSITYRELRSNEFVGIRPAEAGKLLFSKWKNRQEKLLILHPVTFSNKRGFNIHRLLRAIDNNTLLSKLPQSEEALPDEIMLPAEELKKRFAAYPRILENSRRLPQRCAVSFDFKPGRRHQNQRCYTGNADLDFRLLRKLCYDGLPYRYTRMTSQITDRLEMELSTIRQQHFVSYFLITWKIVKYARERGCFYVGRGSGANSIVSYLLRITDVDPIELDLYFERFINLFRQSPPDFDIDFSWKDRRDVTAFIFRRFAHTALLATYNTFQYKAVIRELGKVFGLPADEIIKLQKEPHKADETGKLILRYSRLIRDFPSHLSVHAGGIIIAEKPITYYTATFLPPKGFPTTRFDMITAEDVGLYKWDILGQRGLAKIRDALEIIRENRPDEPPIDIHDVRSFYRKEKINRLLKSARAIGCFYIESPAMRMLLKKLDVDSYRGLVAASSVIRPGVARSGMMREYIIRHRFPEKRREAHPVLLQLMPETYGVMVYQEDVIKVAHHFAGLSPAEADVLRRGMSGKFRSREEFLRVQEKFFSNCRKKGYKEAMIQDVWRQIESFAGYAFAKGHSASYAVESYQCLFLKAHYPLEYMLSVINNGGGFYRTEFYVHEARMCGAVVHAPCINHSGANAVIYGQDIYLGFSFLKGLAECTIGEILQERACNGPFTGLRDFIKRVPLSLTQLVILIRIGAFRFEEKSKKELLWDAHFLLGKGRKAHSPRGLFDPPMKEFRLPPLHIHELQDVTDELELLGFPLSSPFRLLEKMPQNIVKAADLPSLAGKKVRVAGYLVHVKTTATKDKRHMHFGTLLDEDGHWIDSIHFPQVTARYPFRGPGCYLLSGKVVDEFAHCSIEVEWMKRLPNKNMEEKPGKPLTCPMTIRK